MTGDTAGHAGCVWHLAQTAATGCPHVSLPFAQSQPGEQTQHACSTHHLLCDSPPTLPPPRCRPPGCWGESQCPVTWVCSCTAIVGGCPSVSSRSLLIGSAPSGSRACSRSWGREAENVSQRVCTKSNDWLERGKQTSSHTRARECPQLCSQKPKSGKNQSVHQQVTGRQPCTHTLGHHPATTRGGLLTHRNTDRPRNAHRERSQIRRKRPARAHPGGKQRWLPGPEGREPRGVTDC